MNLLRVCVSALSLVAVGGGVLKPADPPMLKDGPLGMKFVALPKGTTYLGWDNLKGSAKKTVITEDFEIAVYLVTQGQWQAIMGRNPSAFSRRGSNKASVVGISEEGLKLFPVESVSWHDCQEFLKKLNEKEKGKGHLYRVPTEGEWEYACRGGATTENECSYHFYFAEPTNDLSSKQANFNGNHPAGKGEKGPNLGRTTTVGSYAPNKLGLYDMHGNVGQWTSPSKGLDVSDPVLRGGGWLYNGQLCRAAASQSCSPSTRLNLIGFRLVRVPSAPAGK